MAADAQSYADFFAVQFPRQLVSLLSAQLSGVLYQR
jgi:hypothetical protein